jgi:hypothetical protein
MQIHLLFSTVSQHKTQVWRPRTAISSYNIQEPARVLYRLKGSSFGEREAGASGYITPVARSIANDEGPERNRPVFAERNARAFPSLWVGRHPLKILWP